MLNKYSAKQLKQLSELISNLTDEEYSKPMEDTFKSSIGKHTRHIIEFYLAFNKGYKNGLLNYDKRKRDERIEEDREFAIKKLEKLQKKMSKLPNEKSLILKLKVDGQSYFMPTTVAREFLYLMEHTTHHIALIRMGIENISPEKNNFKNLGIAYSTPKK